MSLYDVGEQSAEVGDSKPQFLLIQEYLLELLQREVTAVEGRA